VGRGEGTRSAVAVRRAAPDARRASRAGLLHDELRAVLAAAKGTAVEGLVGLIAYTAVRRTEAASAKWADFDFESREWVIPQTKTGRPHGVGLSAGAFSVLAAIPQEGSHLFPQGAGFRTDPPLDAVKAVVSDSRLHDLRRRVRTRLPELGISPDTAGVSLATPSVASGPSTTVMTTPLRSQPRSRSGAPNWTGSGEVQRERRAGSSRGGRRPPGGSREGASVGLAGPGAAWLPRPSPSYPCRRMEKRVDATPVAEADHPAR
jgi:integrase